MKKPPSLRCAATALTRAPPYSTRSFLNHYTHNYSADITPLYRQCTAGLCVTATDAHSIVRGARATRRRSLLRPAHALAPPASPSTQSPLPPPPSPPLPLPSLLPPSSFPLPLAVVAGGDGLGGAQGRAAPAELGSVH